MPTNPQPYTRTTLGAPPDLSKDVEEMKQVMAETKPSGGGYTGGSKATPLDETPSVQSGGYEGGSKATPLTAVDAEPDVTGSEVASTIAKRTTGSAIQSGSVLSGAVMGTKLAAQIPAPGPIKAGLMTLGLTGGAIAGHLYGDGVTNFMEQQGLALSDIKDVRPNLRPFAAFGEVLGGGIPFVGAPLLMARLGIQLPTSYAGDFINSIVRQAAKTPVGFAGSNLAASVQAGVASGAVEAVAPDSPYLRAGAEIIGGATSSLRSKALGMAKDKLMTTLRGLTPHGRQTAAGRTLVNILDEGRRDPHVVLELLSDEKAIQQAIGGPPLTAAQVTGDPVLAEIQAGLSRVNPVLGGQMARQAKGAVTATTNAIRLLRGTGDPMALRQAAELRREQMETALEGMVEEATTKMQRSAAGISADRPQEMARLSKEATTILDETIDRARSIEKQLWKKVADGPLPPEGYDNVLAAYDRAKTEILQQETVHPLIANVVNDIRQAQEVMAQAAYGVGDITPAQIKKAVRQLSIGELSKVRSRFLKLARATVRSNDPNLQHNVKIFNDLADAALLDLEAAGVSAGRNATAAEQTAFDEARTWSRELNNVFTRSMVGDLDEVGRRGQLSYNPESLMRRSLLVGQEMTDTNFKELEVASRFLLDRGRGTPLDTRQYQNMMQIQERALRLIASQSVTRDPVTNVVTGVNTQKLRDMTTKYAEVLDRFPEAKQAIEGAIQSDGGRQAMMAIATEQRGYLSSKSVLAKVLDVESPIEAVRTIFADKNPQGLFQRAATLAKRAGPQAVEGLRAASFESAVASSTMKDGKVSLPALLTALNQPLRPGVPSMTGLMRQQGLITDEEAGLLKQLTDHAERLIATNTATATGHPLEDATDAIVDTMLRVTGSFGGRLFGEGVGKALGQGSSAGTSLIAAQRGSSAARALFEKAGQLKSRTLLEGALRGDPITPGGERFGLLKVLLEKGMTPEKMEQNLMLVNAYLISTGVRTTETLLQGEAANGDARK